MILIIFRKKKEMQTRKWQYLFYFASNENEPWDSTSLHPWLSNVCHCEETEVDLIPTKKEN
jgi:hypothetical protein